MIRIIVGNTGFEPRTSASEVWYASNEPPHLRAKMQKESHGFAYHGEYWSVIILYIIDNIEKVLKKLKLVFHAVPVAVYTA